MINRPDEYKKMISVENSHWWYKILHLKCELGIKKYFSSNKQVSILDIGCGTGGLMTYLDNLGYLNLSGFDFSEIAVNECQKKKFFVWQGDVKNLNSISKKFDIIICNDVLYFLNDSEMSLFFKEVNILLNLNGILIFNLPAFKNFSGIHDVAVGINKRYTKNDIIAYIDKANYQIKEMHYWPFFLSPIIFIARTYQRLCLKMKMFNKIESDVRMPNKYINYLLFKISLLEQYFYNKNKFGSSIFTILKKINQNEKN